MRDRGNHMGEATGPKPHGGPVPGKQSLMETVGPQPPQETVGIPGKQSRTELLPAIHPGPPDGTADASALPHAREVSSIAASLGLTGRAGASADATPSGAPADEPQQLPDPIRGELASAAGRSLDHVRLHTGERGNAVATAHGARAVAIGGDIHMGQGQLDTESPDGRELLAHEVAHTVQAQVHGGAVRAAAKRDSSSTDAAEIEADALAAQFRKHGSGARWTPGVAIAPSRPMRAPDAGHGATPQPPHAPAGQSTAAVYFADNQARFFDAIRTRIASLALPAPHERLLWGSDALRGIALEHTLTSTYGSEMDLALALPALLHPAPAFEIIDSHRDLSAGRPGERIHGQGALGPSTWNPIAGTAIAIEIEACLRRSLPRMGLRYVARADDSHDPVTPEQLVASMPFDRVVAQLLCDPAVARFVSSRGKPAKRTDPAQPIAFKDGIRLVRYEWLGKTDPKLWNWIRVTDPNDALPEEVAATIWERLDAENHTEYAYALTAAPPYFRIPPDTARHFPEAASYAPRMDVAEDMQARSALGLAASGPFGDAVAREQAGPVAKGDIAKIDVEVLRDQLDLSEKLLRLATARLDAWNLGPVLASASEWVRLRKDVVRATPVETLKLTATSERWSAIASAQSATLQDAIGDLVELLDLAQAAHIVPGAPEARPFHEVIEAIAIAIGESHLAQSGKAQLDAARRRKAMLSLTLLDQAMREGHDAAQELAATDRVPVGAADRVDPRTTATAANRTLEAGALGLRQKAVATGTIDADELQSLTLAASQETLRARLLTLYGKLGQLRDFSDEAIDGFFGHVANARNSDIWNLRAELAALQPRVWTIVDTMQREAIPPPPLPADPAAAQASFAEARRLAVLHAQTAFSALAETAQLQTLFQRALGTLTDAQKNTAYFKLAVEIAALIGVSIIGSVAGSLVGGLVRGAILADAATDAAVFARTATAGRLIGGAANVATDAAVQAIAQTGLHGGNTKLTFVENVITNLMTLGALRPLHTLGGEIGQLDRNAVGLWKVASGGKVVLAATAKLTIETLVAAGASYVAARLVEGHPPPTEDVAISWAMQGASMAVGKFVHVRLQEFTTRWGKLGEQHVHLLKRAQTQQALATLVEHSGSTESALLLLEEHTRLLHDERALLSDPAAVARLGLDATQLEVLRAGNHAALAETHAQAFDVMRLRFAGLQPAASNGLVWSGTRAQIEAAIGEVGAAATQIHDGESGQWTARIGGRQVTFIEVQRAPTRPPASDRPGGPAGPDLHSHVMGVPDVDYFVAKLGKGSSLAALDALYAGLSSNPRAQKSAAHAWKMAQAARVKIDSLQNAGAAKLVIEDTARKALNEMFAAGEHTPFNVTYQLRQFAVETFIDRGGGPYRNFARDVMLALGDEGIGYSEQSVGLDKLHDKFPEDMMTDLHRELAQEGKDVDIRFLAMVSTKALTGEAPKGAKAEKATAAARATSDQLAKVLARGDVIGIDIGGAEREMFSSYGMETFENLYEIVSAAALKRGTLDEHGNATPRPLVLRPHVGEGYNEGPESKHTEIAQKNLEMLIIKLEAMGYNPAKAHSDGVIVRFGHATHATPNQLQRMAALGIIVEANIGSNLITSSVSALKKHPLLLNLYYGVNTVLGTDGGGVMQTSRQGEYLDAQRLIDQYRNNEFPLNIDGKDVRYKDLAPAKQARFSMDNIKRAEDAYHHEVTRADRTDSARDAERHAR